MIFLDTLTSCDYGHRVTATDLKQLSCLSVSLVGFDISDSFLNIIPAAKADKCEGGGDWHRRSQQHLPVVCQSLRAD